MPRLPKRLRPSLLVLAIALPSACRAAGGGSAGPAGSGPVVLTQPGAPGDPALAGEAGREGLFQTLQAALAAGDDEVAAHVAAGLKARPLTAREAALVDSAERVLAGRALVRQLDLRLVSEPGDDEGTFRLVLLARSGSPGDVRLRLPPCDLKRLRASMDARGVEGLDYESKLSSALRDLSLAPTVERRVELLTYELPLGRALAVRERWRLETRTGEIESGGKRFPASAIRVGGCERERLSPLVTGGPADPGELAEALEARPAPRSLALLELALRVTPETREDTLARLVPVVARLAREEPGRIAAAEPALRWLTQNRDLGPDAAAWARYLEAHLAAAAAPPPAAGGLDLPVRDSPRRSRAERDEDER